MAPSKVILLVEDEKILRELIAAELMKHGYTVHVATDGEEALKLLAEVLHIDLILLDLLMPVVDGYQVLSFTRNQSTHREVPIVVLSNSGHIEDLHKAYALGATDVLIKALFTPVELVGKVQRLLSQPAA